MKSSNSSIFERNWWWWWITIRRCWWGVELIYSAYANNTQDNSNHTSPPNTNASSTDTGTSDNFFLRLANYDYDRPDAYFIAYTFNNAIIYSLKNTPPISNAHFHGIMIDSATAYSSSENENRYYDYCKLIGFIPSIDSTQSKLILFGIGKEMSKGTAQTDFPMENLWLTFKIRILSANITIILGMNNMDRLDIHFNNLTNKLVHPKSGYFASNVGFRGHADTKWDPHLQTHFTENESHHLHRRFGHPSTYNLANFLILSGLDDSSGHRRTTLESVAQHFHPCQRYAQAPRRLNFKIKGNFQFNHTIYVEVF